MNTTRETNDVFYKVQFECDPKHADLLEIALEDWADATSRFEIPHSTQWMIEGISPLRPDTILIESRLNILAISQGINPPKTTFETLPQLRWLETNAVQMQPIHIGRLFITNQYHETLQPFGAIPIHIEAATAFGSGYHPTTRGCLLALNDIFGRQRGIKHILDMGCGSGILAISAIKLGGHRALAVDCDQESIHKTKQNAAKNEVSHKIHTVQNMGFVGHKLKTWTPIRGFDLMLANILAKPLVDFVNDATSIVTPAGWAILSGFTDDQSVWVENRYRSKGWTKKRTYIFDHWVTLVLQKS